MTMNETKPLGLVIEDSPAVAKMFATALAEAGFETEIILEGFTGQKRLAQQQPAIIILDIHLPDISGDVILQQVRSDPRLAATLVVLATADANYAQHIQDEADFVLLKPISYVQLRQLAARLQKAIRQPQ